jgi:GR25 family glycosyltransferase involved in LPS biosynthesis
MNVLPKIFCLTLKDTPQRKEYAERHFKERGLDVEFFDGINGAKFGLRTTIPYKDDNPEGDDYFITAGHIGCILSHYMLWKTLMYLPYDEILIFEDDVILSENFVNKFQEYKTQLPDDWQYTFVGHCCMPPNEHQTKITDNVITTSHSPMCTHAYMIKKSSIPTLLDTNHIAWAHIDIQIQKRSLKKMQHYVFVPPLAEQQSTLATEIIIKQNDQNHLFKSLTLDWKHHIKT